MLTIDGFIHGAHVVGSDFSGEGVKSHSDLRPPVQRFVPDKRDGLVWREVMPVVLKGNEAERLDGAVG